RMRLERRPVFFGDAGRPELLERVGGARARAFVVTLNNPLAAERMVAAALKLNPKAMIFARAADPAHAVRLLDCGAVSVIPETVEGGLQLTARLLEGLDLPDEAVIERVAAMRAAELGRLAKDAANDTNKDAHKKAGGEAPARAPDDLTERKGEGGSLS
ncbi:MAG: NAD-binding protein, partial [Pseudolabrys sp.]